MGFMQYLCKQKKVFDINEISSRILRLRLNLSISSGFLDRFHFKERGTFFQNNVTKIKFFYLAIETEAQFNTLFFIIMIVF